MDNEPIQFESGLMNLARWTTPKRKIFDVEKYRIDPLIFYRYAEVIKDLGLPIHLKSEKILLSYFLSDIDFKLYKISL